jgi:hypothetical protein
MRAGYRLVSWWPPLSLTIVIPPAGPNGDHPASRTAGRNAVAARLETVRQPVLLLQVFGMLSLLALVVLVPLGMRWWGGAGFLLSLLVVFLLSWLVTGHSYFTSKALGLSTRQRFLFALPRMNPFAAPAAGEALLTRVLEGADPIAVASELMEEAEFERWIRPMAYDVTQGFDVEGGKELLRVMTRSDLTRIVSAPTPGVTGTGPWCPRCGAELGPASTSCSS